MKTSLSIDPTVAGPPWVLRSPGSPGSRPRGHGGRLLLTIVVALAVLLLVLTACRSRAPEAGNLAQPDAIGSRAARAVPVELLALPDAGSGPLLNAIDAAQESLRLKAYLITEEAMIEALTSAAGRGVEVRVLLEPEPFGGGDSNRLAADALRQGGVDVRSSPAAFRLSHEKSLVVDGRRAYIMTHNLTRSAFERNREYAVVVDEPSVVEEVVNVFEADWERLDPELASTGPGLSAPSLVWSPVNSRQRVYELLDGAQVSLDLEQSSILDDGVVERLLAAAGRGVRVRLVTPAIASAEDVEAEPLSRLVAGGVAIRFLDNPYVHAKAILADGQVALVGSQNLTNASLDFNRELGIIFDDAGAVNRLASYFLQDWNEGVPWIGSPTSTPAPGGTEVPSAMGAYEGVVPWEQAGEYVGQTITVEGDIIDTYNAGRVAFLNFSRDRDDFTLVVFADDFDRFPEPPEELYRQKRVRVTGLVELYQGRPEIIVESPDQLEIVGELALPSPTPVITLPPGHVVPWQDAGQYMGQQITVEGQVVRSYNSGKVAFLNFVQDYRGTLSIVIFAADFDQWPQPPDQIYQGQWVRVTGKVKEYEGAPEIVVESPEQIEILALDAEHPGTAQPTAGLVVSPEVPSTPEISWEQAARYMGQVVAVTGIVVDSYKSDTVIFLNFSPNRDEFKVVIFKDDWDRWTRSPDELYYGQAVSVTGEVKEYQGGPEIIVERPDQIEILD